MHRWMEYQAEKRSVRAKTRVDIGGTTTSEARSPARPASAGSLAARVIVAASAAAVSQSYTGIEDNTDDVAEGGTESALP